MLLTGSDNERPMPQCKTKDLDHPTVPDFTQTSTFVASKEEQDIGWYTCWGVSYLCETINFQNKIEF